MNINEMLQRMIAGARHHVDKAWPEIAAFAEPALRQVAQNVLTIRDMMEHRLIDDIKAKKHFAVQTDAAKAVLVACCEMSKIQAEGTINAALVRVRTYINNALGWTLIGELSGKLPKIG